MNILAVDVGGTHVKILLSGQTEPRKMVSGPALTAAEMVQGVHHLAGDWEFDAVSIGVPTPVVRDKPIEEPIHLGQGWVDFDYAAAFGCPVKIVNDAAMQAMGSYVGDKMLFLGLGTGLGSALVIDGALVPLELGHLPYRKRTYEDYVGVAGLERMGRKKWERRVHHVVDLLCSAFEPDYVLLGGGNAKLLNQLPPRCRLGNNANAFVGGFRLWQDRSAGASDGNRAGAARAASI
ncbi:MAG: ROK family protein [Pirellulales bacterium]